MASPTPPPASTPRHSLRPLPLPRSSPTLSQVEGCHNLREGLRNTQNVTNITSFRGVLGGVMDDIATRASNGGSAKKFATSEANFSSLQTLYGLAQCTPDLNVLDCNKCLRDGISNFPSCFDGNLGARVLFRVLPVLQPHRHCTAAFAATGFSSPSSSSRSFNQSRGGISTQGLIAILVPIGVSVLHVIVVGSGFGLVYKVAVKRLSRTSGQGAEEFKNEYPQEQEKLDWLKHYKIIEGIA
ncbi:unnamed protein product [Camellia sinensis]